MRRLARAKGRRSHDQDIEKRFYDFFHGALHVAALVAGPGRRIRPYIFVGWTRLIVHRPLKGPAGLSTAGENPTVSAC